MRSSNYTQSAYFTDSTAVLVNESYREQCKIGLNGRSFGPHESVQALQNWWRDQKSKDSVDYPGHLDQVRRKRQSLMELDLLNERTASTDQKETTSSTQSVGNANVPVVSRQGAEHHLQITNIANGDSTLERSPTVTEPIDLTMSTELTELTEPAMVGAATPDAQGEIPVLVGSDESGRISDAISETDRHPDETEACLQQLIDDSVHNMTWATKVLYKYRSIQQTKSELEQVGGQEHDKPPRVLQSTEFRHIISQPILPSQRGQKEEQNRRAAYSLSSLPPVRAVRVPQFAVTEEKALINGLAKDAVFWSTSTLHVGNFDSKSDHNSRVPVAEHENAELEDTDIFDRIESWQLRPLSTTTTSDQHAAENKDVTVLSVATGKQTFQANKCSNDDARRPRDSVSRCSQTKLGQFTKKGTNPLLVSFFSNSARDLTGGNARASPNLIENCARAFRKRPAELASSTSASIADPISPRALNGTEIFLHNLLTQSSTKGSYETESIPSLNYSFDRHFHNDSEDIHLASRDEHDFWTDVIVAPPSSASQTDNDYTTHAIDFLQKQSAKSAAILSEQLNKLSRFLLNQSRLTEGSTNRLGMISFPLASLRTAEPTSIFSKSDMNPYDGSNARVASVFWNHNLRQTPGEDGRRRAAGLYSKMRMIEKTCQKILGCDSVAGLRLLTNDLTPDAVRRLAGDRTCTQLWPQVTPVNFDEIKFLCVLPKEADGGESATISEDDLLDGVYQLRHTVDMQEWEICILTSSNSRV